MYVWSFGVKRTPPSALEYTLLIGSIFVDIVYVSIREYGDTGLCSVGIIVDKDIWLSIVKEAYSSEARVPNHYPVFIQTGMFHRSDFMSGASG